MATAELKALVAEAIEAWKDDSETIPTYRGRLEPFGFDAMAEASTYLNNDDAEVRAAAGYLMGHLSLDGNEDTKQFCLDALLGALATERATTGSTAVLEGLVHGLSDLSDIRSAPPIIALADHDDADVRFAVATELPCACGFKPFPEAVNAMIRLTADPDDDVRNWACFGLHQMSAESDEAREALAARLDDPHNDTRSEALSALADMGDERVIPRLMDLLSHDSVWTLEVEAAGLIADERLYPLLKRIETWWEDDNDSHVLQTALQRCDPRAAELAAEHEQTILPLLNEEAEKQGGRFELIGNYPLTKMRVFLNNKLIHNTRFWRFEDPFSLGDINVEVATLLTWLHPPDPVTEYAVTDDNK